MPTPLKLSRPFRPSRATVPALAVTLAMGLACRSDRVAHYRVPKETQASHPDHPGHAEEQAMGAPGQGMPSATPTPGPGAPAAAQPAPGAASLKWNLPKGWSQQPGSGMRFATLQTPVAGKLEATVVVLPGPAGGELANVNRWRGQIALPALDEAALAKARITLKTRAGALNVYDFTSEGATPNRMVAGYITTPDGNTWFLKLNGEAAPVAQARPDFMRILESLHLD